MAKPPKPGKCVHCLRDPIDRNWDHVFPRSWYPATTPANLLKWKVPSCVPCNSELGAIEEDFLVRIALCLDENAPASQSIVEKALRAMSPKAAASPTDRQARASLARRIMAQVLEGPEVPTTGIYPFVGERRDPLAGEDVAVRIPATSFRRLTEKIVRGITFVEDEKYIEPPFCIEFHALDEDGAQHVRRLLDEFGVTYSREPAIVVRRAVSPDDGISSIFEIEFWGQFKTHAFVVDKTL
jgi:hypothetical protein